MTERGGSAGSQQPDWICERCRRLLPEGSWDISLSDEWLCRSCSESVTERRAPHRTERNDNDCAVDIDRAAHPTRGKRPPSAPAPMNHAA